MKKKVVASLLSFVGAAFILAYGICVCLAGGILKYSAAEIVSATAVCGFSAVSLFACGGLILIGEKRAFIAGLVGLALAFIAIVPLCFIGTSRILEVTEEAIIVLQIEKWLQRLLLACRIIAPLSVICSLVIMPKIKGAIYFVACLFSLLTALVLGCYVYFRGLNLVYMVMFIIFGAVGGLLAVLGGLNKSESATSLLLALLLMAGQLIIACAMCTQINGIANVILCFGGTMMAIVGGILVADTNESGFIIISFGIILLLGWVLFTMFMVNKAIALGLLCVMVSVILSAATVLKSRFADKQ